MNYYRGMTIGDGAQASDVWEFRVADHLDDSDTVSGATVTPESGLTATLVTFDDDSIFVRISGGTAGTTYTVRVIVTTAAGDTFDMLVNYEVSAP